MEQIIIDVMKVFRAYTSANPLPPSTAPQTEKGEAAARLFAAVYNAGRVQGLREERARRNRIKV